jgi:hypothetical protein
MTNAPTPAPQTHELAITSTRPLALRLLPGKACIDFRSGARSTSVSSASSSAIRWSEAKSN